MTEPTAGLTLDAQTERFLVADRAQRTALTAVDHYATVKMEAVVAMRDAGLTFSEIGRRVGLSVPGVQRIAYKVNRP